MRKLLFFAPIVACLGSLLYLWLPINAQIAVTVTGADAVQKFNTTSSSGLTTVLDQAKIRIITAYQSALFRPPLVAPSNNWLAALNTVPNHVLVDNSSALFRPGLKTPAQQWLSTINQSVARVVANYAQRNLKSQLAYPKDLLNDQQAPVISSTTVGTVAGKPALLWATDEFSRCKLVIRQGSQVLGEYEESEYSKQHSQLLPTAPSDAELTAETQCTDQSNNMSQQSKLEFTLAPPVKKVYLPLVTK